MRTRPCSFASGSDRSASAARHNGSAHASAATSSRPLRRTGPKGRVCDPCYAAALRHRGTCDSCRATRRLVVPAGPDATTCADCAGLDPTHVCIDCGTEGKLYEGGRCERCALARRTSELLRPGGGEQIPAAR